MSMTVFMIWQMVGIFCAYFGVTTLLPMAVFHNKLKNKSFSNKMLFCFLFGNSYIVTVVQLLQICNISYPITLFLVTAVPALILGIKYNHIPIKKTAFVVGQHIKWMTEKQLGFKTVLYRFMAVLKKCVLKVIRVVDRFILANLSEIILQAMLFLVLLWVYGKGIVMTYGYSASDIPVHNYWINAMGDNNIFVAGVYPHGYHCIIYYLHELFGFDTYVLLSLFAFVQVVCVHFALLYFLKLCCKTRYVPYIGAFLYGAGNFFVSATYSRFSSTLPQEFGMVFILPAIYYGFEFFEKRYEEVRESKKQEQAGSKRKVKKQESLYSLMGFAMSFGMTLSVHFYNTVIAGIFCAAMALGYLFLLLRKQYFLNVVATCFISLMVAILPMGIAFATGTPLQGSLYWATNVIMGSSESDEAQESTTGQAESGQVPGNAQNVGNGISGAGQSANTSVQQGGNNTTNGEAVIGGGIVSGAQTTTPPKKSVGERLAGLGDSIEQKIQIMNNSIDVYVMNKDGAQNGKFFWGMILFSIALGVLYIVLRKPCYGAMLISAAIYMVLMAMILAAGRLGIPKLMDPARACIYFAYSLPILLVLPLDGVLHLLTGCGRWKEIGKVLSLGCMFLAFWLMVSSGNIREAYRAGHFETNEAVTCLTNIIQQEEDFMWTICSANDELRMGEDHGFHYETITFLKNMERKGEQATITIPTPKVYFFIEKIPLDYAVSYKNSGQRISEKGANRAIPYSTGLSPYQGENRWIVMSRMYYWAQEFRRMYPNEMKVYLETDKFVCYVIEQNPYSLYNFAIDYGYNTKRY